MSTSRGSHPRTRRRSWLVLALLGCLVTLRPEQTLAASAFAGALEPTQIANFIQLIQQAVKLGQQVRKAQKQVEYWQQNLRQFDDGGSHFALTKALVLDVSRMIGTYQAIAFGRDSNLEVFQKRYPGYQDPPGQDYHRAYRELDRDTLKSVERSLALLDVQINDPRGGIKAEDALITELAARAQSADGMVKALGVTNDLLVLMAKQLQKLQLAMTAQAQAMNHFMAGNVQRRAYEERKSDRYFEFRRTPEAPAPVDWSREGSRGLL